MGGISAAEMYERVGDDRPVCECHGEPKQWSSHAHRKAGGSWVCAVRRRASQARYCATDKYRAAKARYHASDKGREMRARYCASEKNREASRRRRACEREAIAEFIPPALLALYKGAPCVYCGKPSDTIEHFHAINDKGPHVPSNLLPACKSCNSRRGPRSPWPYLAARAA